MNTRLANPSDTIQNLSDPSLSLRIHLGIQITEKEYLRQKVYIWHSCKLLRFLPPFKRIHKLLFSQ